MTHPIRIQRKRTKGFDLQAKSPDGRPVVSVTRPGKWGNVFRLIGDQIFIHAGHRRKILDPWVLVGVGDESDVVKWYEMIVTGKIPPDVYLSTENVFRDFVYHMARFKSFDISELRNKHLACFCRLGKPCHVDVLLKLANQ